VTHLRKLTLDEIARRNYTEGTTRAYVRIIEDLARYFHRSPDQLDPEQLREYTAHLFVTGNSPTTRSIRSSVRCVFSFARS
jgi:integrase/recombinase XerD